MYSPNVPLEVNLTEILISGTPISPDDWRERSISMSNINSHIILILFCSTHQMYSSHFLFIVPHVWSNKYFDQLPENSLLN